MLESLPKYRTSVQSLRNWARVRLIVLDLDGTLVAKQDPHVFDNLRTLRASLRHPRHRVLVTVATGRALAGAEPLLKGLNLPFSVPVILYNGSVVYTRTGVFTLHRNQMAPNVVQKVLAITKRTSLNTLAYYAGYPDDAAIAPEGLVEQVYGWSTLKRYPTEINGLPVQWNRGSCGDRGPVAILVEARSAGELHEIAHQVVSACSVSVTRSGSRFLEIRPIGSDKGSALEVLARHLDVPRESVLAVGDADNDAEMLRWAGMSVAIRGASEMALQSSMFVTDYGAARGAVEVLRAVRSARRYFGE